MAGAASIISAVGGLAAAGASIASASRSTPSSVDESWINSWRDDHRFMKDIQMPNGYTISGKPSFNEGAIGVMNEQYSLQDAWNQKAEARQLEYSDPSFLRSRLENAGYNPNALFGTSAPQAMQASAVSAPTGSASQRTNVGDRLEQMTKNFSDAFAAINSIQDVRDHRKASRLALEAQALDNKERENKLLLQAEELTRLRNDNMRSGSRWADEATKNTLDRVEQRLRMRTTENADRRADEAHSISVRQGALDLEHSSRRLFYDYQNELRAQGEYRRAEQMSALDLAEKQVMIQIANQDLSEKELRNKIFRETGAYPPTGKQPSKVFTDLARDIFGESVAGSSIVETLKNVGNELMFGRPVSRPDNGRSYDPETSLFGSPRPYSGFNRGIRNWWRNSAFGRASGYGR